MRRKIFLKVFIVFCSIWPPSLLAQFTQTQGTIKDPTGLPYTNGTITPTLVCSASPRFLSSGFPYTPPAQATGLDTNGSFVMQLADVTQLTPSGCTWSFHVCSAAGTIQPGSPITGGPTCFDVTGLAITGTVQDISAQLSAAAPRLGTGGTSGGATVPTPGTPGQLLFYNTANTVAGSPLLTVGTPSVTGTVTPTINLGAPLVLASTPNQGIVCSGATAGISTTNSTPGQFGCINAGAPGIQFTGSGGGLRYISATAVNGNNLTTNLVAWVNNTSTNPPTCNTVGPANSLCLGLTQQGGTGGGTLSYWLVGNGVATNFLNGVGQFVPLPASVLTDPFGIGNPCFTVGVAITTSTSIICSFNMPASPARNWTIDCAINWTTSASSPITISISAGQPNTSGTGNIISAVISGTSTATNNNFQPTTSNSPVQLITVPLSGGPTSGVINITGGIMLAASAGTLQLTGTVPSGLGTINDGSWCKVE